MNEVRPRAIDKPAARRAGHRRVLHPRSGGVPRVRHRGIVVGADADDQIARAADEAVSVADVDVVGVAVAVKIAVGVLRGVGVEGDLRKCADVVGHLAAEQQAGRGQDRPVVLLELGARVLGLGGVGDFGVGLSRARNATRWAAAQCLSASEVKLSA
jgi:hypothetical protein